MYQKVKFKKSLPKKISSLKTYWLLLDAAGINFNFILFCSVFVMSPKKFLDHKISLRNHIKMERQWLSL